MKKILLSITVIACFSVKAQTVIQTVNSGSLITSSSSVSIGEIVIVPENTNQTSSGIIAILAQNSQTLEVPQLEISEKITVFPNPTTSFITFQSDLNLENERVSIVNLSGQQVSTTKIDSNNGLDLSNFPSGIYIIQFENKKINSFKIIKK